MENINHRKVFKTQTQNSLIYFEQTPFFIYAKVRYVLEMLFNIYCTQLNKGELSFPAIKVWRWRIHQAKVAGLYKYMHI